MEIDFDVLQHMGLVMMSLPKVVKSNLNLDITQVLQALTATRAVPSDEQATNIGMTQPTLGIICIAYVVATKIQK